MNLNKFLTKIQNYYGLYPEGQIPVIKAYLTKKSDEYLSKLYGLVILNFSSQYKVPPDISIFEKLKRQINISTTNTSYLDQEKEEEEFTEEQKIINIQQVKQILLDKQKEREEKLKKQEQEKKRGIR